jgi:hypothetical protein
MKPKSEKKEMTVNEDDFSNNFIWYEWGFVSPEQLPTEAHASEAEMTGYGRLASPYESWDDDNRWMT